MKDYPPGSPGLSAGAARRITPSEDP